MKFAFAAAALVLLGSSASAQDACRTPPGFHQVCKSRSEACTYERVCNGDACSGRRVCTPLSRPVTDCYCTKENE